MINKHIYSAKIFLYLFCLSLFVFLAHTAYTKTSVYSDGRYYYAYTRSFVIDRDLMLANEFKKLSISQGKNVQGYPVNSYPPGTSFLWTPLFWMADNLIETVNTIAHKNLGSDGYGLIYQTSSAVTNIILGLSGLYLLLLLLKQFFSKEISFLTVLALFFATNLFFYIAVEPINSHAASFFVASLFTYMLLSDSKRSVKKYLILGTLSGFLGIIRTHDALIGIPALISNQLSKNKEKLSKYASLAVGFLVGFLPQIILWKFFYNVYFNVFLSSNKWGYGFDFANPHIDFILFNPEKGFFVITPIMFFSFIGLFLFRKKNKNIFIYALTYFLLQVFLISSWADYGQGGSFSIRMLVSTYPLLSFGLASIIEKSKKVFKTSETITLLVLFSILNFVLIVGYLLRY